jgi:hypothetical protein
MSQDRQFPTIHIGQYLTDNIVVTIDRGHTFPVRLIMQPIVPGTDRVVRYLLASFRNSVQV